MLTCETLMRSRYADILNFHDLDCNIVLKLHINIINIVRLLSTCIFTYMKYIE